MSKKETAVAEVVGSAIEELRTAFPVDTGFTKIWLPRISFVSQDKTEEKKNPKTGKKEINVITEAGTFFLEQQGDEEVTREDGTTTRVWNKTEVGPSIEGVVLYQRRQLRMYDEKTELYTSSPIYDTADEEVPLFCEKKEVARGTEKDLKAQFMYTDKSGKQKSALEDNRVLYVLHDGEVRQLTLRGSSMYAFMSYSRKVLPPSVLTKFDSETQTKGDVTWNRMRFTPMKTLTGKELQEVLNHVAEIKRAILQEKSYFAAKADETKDVDDDFNALAESDEVPGFGGDSASSHRSSRR